MTPPWLLLLLLLVLVVLGPMVLVSLRLAWRLRAEEQAEDERFYAACGACAEVLAGAGVAGHDLRVEAVVSALTGARDHVWVLLRGSEAEALPPYFTLAGAGAVELPAWLSGWLRELAEDVSGRLAGLASG